MKKLNFLILVPRFVTQVGDGYIFPLGIAYVSASLKTAGFKVFTLNLNHRDGNIDDIIKAEIVINKIDVVCTGGMSMHYNSIHKIIKSAKAAQKDIISIVGGGLITAEPKVAMTALECVDYGVIGEGEITIADLAKCIERNDDFSKVKGIIFYQGEKLVLTEPREELMNIDSLPRPDYDAIELETYLKLPNNFSKSNFFAVISSRSCPFRCTFCFHTVGSKYRQRSIESVIDEIRYLIDTYNIRFFYIADELFGQKKKRVREFCEFARKIEGFRWRTNFRVCDIDAEMVNLLKESGCVVVSLGLESANDSILRSMRKHITLRDIERGLKLLSDAHITIEGNFIFGDKEETYETAMKTLDWWEAHKQYNLNLLWIQTYPGTFLYKYACQKGVIKDRVKYLKDDCPSVNVSKMSDDELAAVAAKMIMIPFDETKNALDISVVSIDSKAARIAVRGYCVECHRENTWRDIKLFSFGDIGMVCSQCGRKHGIRLPDEICLIFIERLSALLKKCNAIGLWGVTYNTFELCNRFDFFSDPRIIFIDSAYAKQMIKLNGKAVYSQFHILKSNVPIVVSLYTNYSQSISMLCEDHFPSVKMVLDAASLVCMEDSDFKSLLMKN